MILTNIRLISLHMKNAETNKLWVSKLRIENVQRKISLVSSNKCLLHWWNLRINHKGISDWILGHVTETLLIFARGFHHGFSYFPLSRECATNLLRTCPSEATFPKLAHFPWQGHTVDEGVRRGTRNNNDTRIEGNWESRWTAGVIRDARLTAKFRDLIKSRRTLASAPREREREREKGKG